MTDDRGSDAGATGRSRAVTFGLAVPATICGFPTGLDRPSPAPAGSLTPGRWLEHLEVDGVDALWTLDQQMGRTPTAEALSVLSYLAALTSRVRLGVAVLVGAARGPVQTAKGFATLDWLSEGRLDVGLGLGAPRHYPSYGIDRRAGGGSGAILDEFIELTRRLWTEEVVDADGRTWQLHEARITPHPLQRPHPPLWIGGGSDRAFERAIQLGAGWISAGRHSSAEFLDLAPRLLETLEEQGRPAGFKLAKRVYVVVGSDRPRAERTVSAWFERFYRNAGLGHAVTVVGGPTDCAEQLAELVAGGADHLILHPLEEDPDQYDLLTTEVIPSVRAAGTSR